MLKVAFDNGFGHIWLGLTDNYEEGKWVYLSSGKQFDVSTSAFSWGNGGYNGEVNNCVITDGEKIYDNDCSFVHYALCVVESALC